MMILKIIRDDYKVELSIIIAVIACLIFNLFGCRNGILSELLANFYVDNNISNIMDIFLAFIGIYITIISILAVTVIGITKTLLEENLEQRLLTLIGTGLATSLITLLTVVFIRNFFSCYFMLLTGLISISIIQFFKFIIIIFIIFKTNMKIMRKSIDEDDDLKKHLLMKIDDIALNTKKNK